MNILGKAKLPIHISGNTEKVISAFLMIFLAQQRLPDKQLEVATKLVTKYAAFVEDDIKEPYASMLLFSTETRKDICKELVISQAHLNNTLGVLIKKEIIGKENGVYIMNPEIVPTKELTFKFSINAE